MEKYTIRLELPTEQREVENLVRESFWNVYRPGCLEHYVLHCLRHDEAFIPELNFVMEVVDEATQQPKLIGQSVCMHASIATDDGGTLPIITLGPIGIIPTTSVRAMARHCSILCFPKQQQWDLEQCASKATSTFTARVASPMRHSSESAIMDCPRVRMLRSSCARS